MTRSPDSLVPLIPDNLTQRRGTTKPSAVGGDANLRAATQVNAVTASLNPPAIMPTQLKFFTGQACPLEAKPGRTGIQREWNRSAGTV
jgi:hypothetical protein